MVDYLSVYRTTAEAEFNGLDGAYVQVAKVGGGTVGQRYDGDWICNLYVDDDLAESVIYHVGTAKTHEEVAFEYAGDYLF